jgi:quercetin dioxygenase-like cupin family protein
MKIFRFDPEVGRSIEQYKSLNFMISKVAHLQGEAVVNCAYLRANGLIGYHQAVAPQLFLVVAGEGWVRGASPGKTAIKAGQAAYWQEGEWHAAGTETGMTAIIIEGANFDPAQFMQRRHPE